MPLRNPAGREIAVGDPGKQAPMIASIASEVLDLLSW